LTAVDASVLPPTTIPTTSIDAAENAGAQNAIGSTTNQRQHPEATEESAKQPNIHAGRALDDAETQDEALGAKTGIEKAAAERASKHNAVVAQLDAEKSAAEGEVSAMELMAYGSVISLMVLVMLFGSIRIKKTQAARLRRRPKSLKRYHLYEVPQ
jgi:hypothetical protein